jgi:hypothetical protein
VTRTDQEFWDDIVLAAVVSSRYTEPPERLADRLLVERQRRMKAWREGFDRGFRERALEEAVKK